MAFTVSIDEALMNGLAPGRYQADVQFHNGSQLLAVIPIAMDAENTSLLIEPSGGLTSSGPIGGPFTPASQTYSLLNNGVSTVNYTRTVSEPWVTVTGPASGSIVSGQSTVFAVSLDAAQVSGFAVGHYTATVTYRDGSGARPLTHLDVQLTVVTNTVSVIASRTSGVAPLAVHFDASEVTSPATTKPFFEIAYWWDFDDPSSGNWAYGNRSSRNRATGPIAAHVFESPGIYEVRLSARDPSGAISNGSVQITVLDPDTVYAGRDTVAISTSGDFNGAPSGARLITSSRWSTVRNHLNTGTRVLLRRGERWTVDAMHEFSSTNTGGTLGAFGTGPKPRIDVSGARTIFEFDGADWRIMDLQFHDISVNDARLLRDDRSAAGHLMEDLLLLRLETTDFDGLAEGSMGQDISSRYTTGRAHGPLFLVDCQNHNVTLDEKKTGEFIMSCERSAFLGCSFQHQPANPPAHRAHFNLRFVWARKVVFSNCRVFGNQDHAQASLRWHAPRHQQRNPNYRDLYTEQVVISGNEIDMFEGANCMTVGTVNPSPIQRFRNILVECNWFRGTDPGNNGNQFDMTAGNDPVQDAGTDAIHIRRNIFDRAEDGECLRIQQNSGNLVSPPPRGVKVYNNTFYTNDTSTGTWQVMYIGPNVRDEVRIHSNVAVADRGIRSINLVRNNGVADIGDNVTGTDPARNWFITTPPLDPRHFVLTAGARALNAARVGEPELYNPDGTIIPTAQAIDAGAWERMN